MWSKEVYCRDERKRSIIHINLVYFQYFNYFCLIIFLEKIKVMTLILEGENSNKHEPLLFIFLVNFLLKFICTRPKVGYPTYQN